MGDSSGRLHMQADCWRNAIARLVRQSERAATNVLCKGVNADVRVARDSGKDDNNGSKGQKNLAAQISCL